MGSIMQSPGSTTEFTTPMGIRSWSRSRALLISGTNRFCPTISSKCLPLIASSNVLLPTTPNRWRLSSSNSNSVRRITTSSKCFSLTSNSRWVLTTTNHSLFRMLLTKACRRNTCSLMCSRSSITKETLPWTIKLTTPWFRLLLNKQRPYRLQTRPSATSCTDPQALALLRLHHSPTLRLHHSVFLKAMDHLSR
ncbi:hypothetical protein BD289DRAFT_441907 [Coniella lustricola]|uniref:Uncharacterized protein n=1 Tax=Coniella lustricola TaxID=2025994 RepID=A0A2T2ZYX0_9PEZI|nr:hypothetical protein BD289DRAFT_441907 [Coniella lustricola]